MRVVRDLDSQPRGPVDALRFALQFDLGHDQARIVTLKFVDQSSRSSRGRAVFMLHLLQKPREQDRQEIRLI